MLVKNDKVVEKFLHFTAAEALDAESLFATINDTLSKCNINHTACIAQCYDSAAVIYIHCHAHRLNLVLVDCVRNIKPVGDFFLSLCKTYKLFSVSFVHAHFIKEQGELEPSQQLIELMKLSDTCWSCQYYSP